VRQRDYPDRTKTLPWVGHVAMKKACRLSKSNKEHQSPKYDQNSILDEEAPTRCAVFYSSETRGDEVAFSRPLCVELKKEF